MTVEDIALTLTPGLNSLGIVRLLEVFATSRKIFGASREELIHFAELNPTIAEAIVGRVAFAQAEREVEHCRRNSIAVVASTDERYPPLLRHAPDYPHVLYVVGNVEALAARSISIIGTRRISSYGNRTTHNLVQGFAQHTPTINIVSGLAFGVDSAAHRAALTFGINTIAVVANALPAVTPAQHTSLAADIVASGGAIVSECHSQTKYRPSLYIARNRIIAGISSATVVAESPMSGGSMVTAKIASDYDRLVMAIPGRTTDKNSEGCNHLIASNKAQLCTSAEQIIRALMWDVQKPADRVVTQSVDVSLSAEQQAVTACFSSDEPLHIDELTALSGIEVSQLLVILMELELQGVVRMLHGSRYELLGVVASV